MFSLTFLLESVSSEGGASSGWGSARDVRERIIQYFKLQLYKSCNFPPIAAYMYQQHVDSGLSVPGSSTGYGHCVVFLGKTLNSHSASLHPGV